MADLHASMLRLVREGADMTMRQACILFGCRDTVRTIRDLAHEMNVGKPAITRGTDRLEELGLLRRKPDPSDRRSILIEITAAGRKAADKLKG